MFGILGRHSLIVDGQIVATDEIWREKPVEGRKISYIKKASSKHIRFGRGFDFINIKSQLIGFFL